MPDRDPRSFAEHVGSLSARLALFVVGAVVAGFGSAPALAAEGEQGSASGASSGSDGTWMVAPVPVSPPPSSPAGSALAPTGEEARPGSPRWRLDPRVDVAFDVIALAHGALAPALREVPEDAGLVLRRARLGLALATDDWEAVVHGELAAPTPALGADYPLFPLGPSAPAPRVTEAYVAYAPYAAWRVAAGAQRVPLSWARLMNPVDQWLGSVPLPVTRLLPDYRVGLTMAGDLGLLQYHLGWFAPFPATSSRWEREGNLFVARLGGEPIGPVGDAPWRRLSGDPWYRWWRFSHALSFAYADLPRGDARLFVLTAEQSLSWRAFTLMAELLWQRRSPKVSGAEAADTLAAWVDAGVFVVADRLALIGRFDWFNGLVGTREATDTFGLSAGAELALATVPSTGPRVYLRATGERRWQRFGGDAFDGARLSLVLAR